MQRYFIDESKENIQLSDEQIHHIKNVMRMHVDDEIEIIYKEEGFIYKIVSLNPFEITQVSKIKNSSELNVNLVLLYCLPKGDKLELVIQKATEIGVNEIVLVKSSRCISKFTNDDFRRKRDRYIKIATEASEQSHRFKVPKIEKMINYKDIAKLHFDYAYIAYENEDLGSFKDDISKIKKGDRVAILIGPEGGFSLEEVEYAEKCNYKSITLGKRILRSETACISSLSVLAYLFEEV